jgi:hypothetical protein
MKKVKDNHSNTTISLKFCSKLTEPTNHNLFNIKTVNAANTATKPNLKATH